MKLIVKPIINNLFCAELLCEEYRETAVGETEEAAIKKVAQRLNRALDFISKPENSFEITETSRIKIFKRPIESIASLADHYYLSESPGLNNSVGWGPKGLELQGRVRVTGEQVDRINRFIEASKYNIETNNCEHFANYVYYGLNLSSQQHVWWKELSARLISQLQYANSVNDNTLQRIANQLNENLRQAKIEKTKQQLNELCRARGIYLDYS